MWIRADYQEAITKESCEKRSMDSQLAPNWKPTIMVSLFPYQVGMENKADSLFITFLDIKYIFFVILYIPVFLIHFFMKFHSNTETHQFRIPYTSKLIF